MLLFQLIYEIGSNEVVLISFYTEWCRFSSLMMPIFADAAEEIAKAGIPPGKVALAKIDCDMEGPRTVEAFVKFIMEQLTDPIIQFFHMNELNDLSEDMWHVIAYLDSRDRPEYEVLRKVAASVKDECLFHVGFGVASKQMHPPDKVRFLTADGVRLDRMLHLIGKSTSELPLIIFVDYCRSIYLYPHYEGMKKPGNIKQFLQDIDSSKLLKQGYLIYKTSAIDNTEKPDTNEISGDEDDIGDTSLGLFD